MLNTRVADTSPVRWARFFTPIFRCARGRALNQLLVHVGPGKVRRCNIHVMAEADEAFADRSSDL